MNTELKPAQQRKAARKRTDIILLIIFLLYLLILFALKRPEKYFEINMYITAILLTGIFVDYKALQDIVNYRKYLLFSLLLCLFAYILQMKFGYYNNRFFRLSIFSLYSPLSLLISQWLLRHIFIMLVKREPAVKEYPPFTDLIYIILLMCVPMLMMYQLSKFLM